LSSAAGTLPRRQFDELPRARAITLAGALAYALLLVRTAWVCDDAYITFRTVMNVLHGYGLRWNISDRVQAFTHPLWLLVMVGATGATNEVYFTSIALSIALSVGVIVLVVSRLSASIPMTLLALSALAVSKSFVEYSTSGLENALTHLLLATFVVTVTSATLSGQRRVFVVSLLTALLLLNRLDTALLVLPSFVSDMWQHRAVRPWKALAIGMAPFVAWEIFSIIYYGFPVPNTVYAKLGPGIPRAELLHQGALYLLDSIGTDPITLAVVLAALLSPWLLPCTWMLPGGIALYLAYIVWVGGDFMSGRFLSAPFLLAVVHLVRQPAATRFSLRWAAALGLVWLLGLSTPRPVVWSDTTFGDIAPDEAVPASHVTDERRYYYAASGLLRVRPDVSMPDHRWTHLGELDVRAGLRLVTTDAAGFVGYAAGPSVRFVDRWALGDALLARLPAEVPWQIGHFSRRMPRGYERSLLAHANLIEDTGVAAYYDKIRLIVEGPVWSRQRFRTILRMNLGAYDHFLASYGLVHAFLEQTAEPKPDGTPWDDEKNWDMSLKGLVIRADTPQRGGRIEVSVSRNDSYRLRFRFRESDIAEQVVRQPLMADGSLILHVIDVPHDVQWDSIWVVPSGGDGHFAVGHLRVVP
jgi:arabinofuranosyltransferase